MLKRLIVLSGALIGLGAVGLPEEAPPPAYWVLMPSPRDKRAWICPPSRSAR
jgi:hypothetical protein